MCPVHPDPSRQPELDARARVDTWTSVAGDRVVVRQAMGTLWCDPLVGQLLDAAAPTSDPAGGLRPSRHYLLDIDDRDHLVLVASRVGAERTETPIALARCVRLAGSRIGVLGIAVRADLRGRGIGHGLLATMRRFAATRGLERFRLAGRNLPAVAPYRDGPVELAG